MEIILLERVEKLGGMGDVVRVKPGFARNFLLPQKKALRADKANLALFERQRSELEASNLKRRTEAESVAEKMQDVRVVVVRQAADSGHLYGSVTARDIQEALVQEGYSIEKRQVALNSVLKNLGAYMVSIVLHPEVSVKVAVVVARSLTEAEKEHSSELVEPSELVEAVPPSPDLDSPEGAAAGEG